MSEGKKLNEFPPPDSLSPSLSSSLSLRLSIYLSLSLVHNPGNFMRREEKVDGIINK